MAKESAGLLMYRKQGTLVEFLLVHPGGPFWAGKDAGAWTIPKGELHENEAPLAAARREFEEELGFAPQGNFLELKSVKQKSGKIVHAWAFEGDCDPGKISSNLFTIEWPPRSGQMREFPEIDRAGFFGLEQAREKINPAQAAFLDELKEKLPSLLG
jgi:predicted NUDIX family NTP pyrophosphohydrolase